MAFKNEKNIYIAELMKNISKTKLLFKDNNV